MLHVHLFDPEEVRRMNDGEHLDVEIDGMMHRFGFVVSHSVKRKYKKKREVFACPDCPDLKPFKTKMGLAVHRGTMHKKKSNG